MQLNKDKTIRIKENLKILPIWRLTIYLADLERNIFELKKQGVSSTNSQMSKKRCVRGMYRRELLKKLKEWEEGKEEGVGYSDTLNLDFEQEKIEKGLLEGENVKLK